VNESFRESGTFRSQPNDANFTTGRMGEPLLHSTDVAAQITLSGSPVIRPIELCEVTSAPYVILPLKDAVSLPNTFLVNFQRGVHRKFKSTLTAFVHLSGLRHLTIDGAFLYP
jgi:hypothetical protein